MLTLNFFLLVDLAPYCFRQVTALTNATVTHHSKPVNEIVMRNHFQYDIAG